MRACARRAYCKKCRVNLGSKRSGWSNIPDLIFYGNSSLTVYEKYRYAIYILVAPRPHSCELQEDWAALGLPVPTTVKTQAINGF
jgi:hypothetical protein